MNILQTIVGHHLSNLFVDNVAFNVAKLLEESEEEQAANAKRRMFYKALTHYELKGKQPSLTLSLLLAEVLEIPNKNLLVDIISSKATSFNILNVLLEFGID